MGKRYGPNLVIAVGWFVMAALAWWIGDRSVPDPPGEACEEYGTCWDSVLLPMATMLIGPPLLLTLALVTAVVSRFRLPAPVGGTLSAFAAVGVAFVLALVWSGVHR